MVRQVDGHRLLKVGHHPLLERGVELLELLCASAHKGGQLTEVQRVAHLHRVHLVGAVVRDDRIEVVVGRVIEDVVDGDEGGQDE